MTETLSEPVSILADLVRIPSLCGQEDALAGRLESIMVSLGYDEVRRDAVGNVVGRLGPSEAARSVVVLGHMDTAPGVIPVERRNGSLYGRGAVDAKGPLATAVVAAASARLRSRVTVIGAVQEEGPSVGAREIARGPAPDYLIIAEPSGWDSVVLGYKGSQRFTAEIAVPVGHTAGPATTASEEAVSFWNRLTGWCDAASRPRATRAFDRLTTTLIAMESHNDGLRDTARLHVGLRLPLDTSPQDVREAVRSLLPEGDFDFAPGEPAVLGAKTSPLVAAFLRSIRSQGASPRFKVKTGTSDMNVVGPAWQCPMVAYGPGDSSLDHTPHEHLEIDEYLRAVRVLAAVLEEL